MSKNEFHVTFLKNKTRISRLHYSRNSKDVGICDVGRKIKAIVHKDMWEGAEKYVLRDVNSLASTITYFDIKDRDL